MHTVSVAYNNMNDRRPFNADRYSYGAAYTYALSKRTDLNAVITHLKNKNTSQDLLGAAGFGRGFGLTGEQRQQRDVVHAPSLLSEPDQRASRNPPFGGFLV